MAALRGADGRTAVVHYLQDSTVDPPSFAARLRDCYAAGAVLRFADIVACKRSLKVELSGRRSRPLEQWVGQMWHAVQPNYLPAYMTAVARGSNIKTGESVWKRRLSQRALPTPISHRRIGVLGAWCLNGRLTGLYSSPYSNFRRAIDSSARRRSLSRIASNSAMYLAANARTRSRGSSNQSKTSRRFFS